LYFVDFFNDAGVFQINVSLTWWDNAFLLVTSLLLVKGRKKPKIHMRGTRRNLQAQPKDLKKSSKHQINQ
jgi:hypothetical protein